MANTETVAITPVIAAHCIPSPVFESAAAMVLPLVPGRITGSAKQR
ncbi:hypothetical protein ACVINZ_001127 [Mesorhizobium jarvisii]